MKLQSFEERGILQEQYEKIESEFVKFYFPNTCHMLFLRWDYVPIKLVNEMKRTVLDLLPYYKMNPLVEHNNPLMKLLEISMEQDELNYIVKTYQDAFNGAMK